jgi:thiamine-phosphate pyrophosphorylase
VTRAGLPATVCLVTDRSRLPPVPITQDGPLDEARALAPLLERLGLAAEAGIDLLQIREPDVSGKTLYDFVHLLRRRIEGTSARLVVNDRLDVALAAEADGVHLKEESIPTASVRRIVPAGFLVGRSVHDVEGARKAEAEGADYLILGTVFASGSKPAGHRTAGLEVLRAAAGAVRLPVFAIGGISLNTATLAAAAGAAGIAAIGLFFDGAGPPDDLRGRLAGTVASLRRAFDHH